jgi:hypothetical protein
MTTTTTTRTTKPKAKPKYRDNSLHISPEEVYKIFQGIFHNKEDALAATRQLFGNFDFDFDNEEDRI